MRKYNTSSQESYWDNYDLVIWKKDNNGFTNIKGLFRKDNWGVSEKISVDENGMWRLPKRYVRHFK